jgi:hypothetical protein
VDLGPADTLISAGGSITLDAGAGFNSYIWSNGANTQTIQTLGTDTFCVTVSDANGCNASDCIFVDNLTEINQPFSTVASIYPNPSSSFFFIKPAKQLDDVQISIINATGQLTKEFNFARLSDEVSLDVNGLSPGIYHLQIHSKSGVNSTNVIIE